MKVVLYTIGCPRCKVLAKKLQLKGIEFEECHSMEEMNKLGITSVPQIQVDGGELMNFTKANNWINQQEGNK